MKLMSSPRFSGLTPGMEAIAGSRNPELNILKSRIEANNPTVGYALEEVLVTMVSSMNADTVEPFVNALTASPFTPRANSSLDLAVQAAMKRSPNAPVVSAAVVASPPPPPPPPRLVAPTPVYATPDSCLPGRQWDDDRQVKQSGGTGSGDR